MGLAIFQGYYGTNNYTLAIALPLYNTASLFSCTENLYPFSYTFQPRSDVVLTSLPHEVVSIAPASVSDSVSGYWAGGPGLTSPATFNKLSGDYTVLGADEWGNVLLLHFSVLTTVTTLSQTTSTTTSTSCSGYPPGGNCPGTYSYTFTISVNYTGPWKLTYQGYNNLGQYNLTGVSGNATGSGFYTKSVTLSALNTGGLTLCATAQKLDGSSSTLILTVTGFNETSIPYGSVSYCGGVVP